MPPRIRRMVVDNDDSEETDPFEVLDAQNLEEDCFNDDNDCSGNNRVSHNRFIPDSDNQFGRRRKKR